MSGDIIPPDSASWLSDIKISIQQARESKSNSADCTEPMMMLVATLNDLRKHKAAHYGAIAQQLIDTDSRNIQEIEHALDHLLDVACLPESFIIFRSLVRHYWPIDPNAAACYIYAYREMWDETYQPKEVDYD